MSKFEHDVEVEWMATKGNCRIHLDKYYFVANETVAFINFTFDPDTGLPMNKALPQEPVQLYKKPKKLIDWSKMPIGTMTDCGKIVKKVDDSVLVVGTAPCFWSTFSSLRLAEQKEFTYWGGGDCPVPKGVMVEVILRNKHTYTRFGANLYWAYSNLPDDNHIIAYRIIGLAEGYTDNPNEATKWALNIG